MPTCAPEPQPRAESVGVLVLLPPELGTASPLLTLIGVAEPVSMGLVCIVNRRGSWPKPSAPMSVKLAATLDVGVQPDAPQETKTKSAFACGDASTRGRHAAVANSIFLI